MEQKKFASTVLVCPLSWGYGHVSRCIPIVDELTKIGVRVIFAISKKQISKLNYKANNVIIEPLDGFNLRYSKIFPAWLMILFQLPKIVLAQIKDRIRIKRLLKIYRIEKIISDNHYGCIFKKIPSVFITHQLTIKFPHFSFLFEKLFNIFHKIILRNVYECWIPDELNNPNFSGDLSHKYKLIKNTYFIGILSQLQIVKNKVPNSTVPHSYDLLVLLAGQEPQRALLESKILTEIAALKIKTVFIRGTNNQRQFNIENVDFFNFVGAEKLIDLINSSEYILCRSGYSSIMDMVYMNKKAILIPTPGQTEQQYLAKHLQVQNFFCYQLQSKLNLMEGLKILDKLPTYFYNYNNNKLNYRILKLLETK